MKLIDAMNNWANKTVIKPSKPITKPCTSKLKSRQHMAKTKGSIDHCGDEVVVLQTDKDIDNAQHIIASLPSNKKKWAKAVKKTSKTMLENDEILAMIDSGSFLHAIDADVSLPGHEITPVTGPDAHRHAETACGGILHRLGMVKTCGSVDGTAVNMVWNHMKVKVPIVSVRQLVRDGHGVSIGEGGGHIRNTSSGKEIPFFEHAGVYYMKMKIKPPSQSVGDNNESVFSRRAA